MIVPIVVTASILLIGSKLWNLKDSASKLIFGFGGAKWKGGNIKTGIAGGNLNIDLLFNVSNPGKTTIKLDFLMVDAILNVEGGQSINIGNVRLENLEALRKDNPALFTFPAQRTNVLSIPITLPLVSMSNLQVSFALLSGKKIISVAAKGYIMANGFRVEIDQVKEFGKKPDAIK